MNVSSSAEEEPCALGIDGTLASKYIWRGMVWDEDPVLQPDLWMQVGRLTMTFWGNLDLTKSNGDFEGQFNEWDSYVDLNLGARGPVTFGVGLAYMNFIETSGLGSTTVEVNGTVSADVLGNPSLVVNWDILMYHGVYANMGLSHEIAVGPSDLALSLSAGWGDHRHNSISGAIANDGWLDLQTSASYPISLGSYLTLTPSVQYITLLQEDVRGFYHDCGIHPDNWVFAVSAAVGVGR